MTVTINGTTGYTGPIGAIGDLSTTGNTTLGDASSDTLTINGSTTTFTQGTANGVAYLNGSKVLTTGSALTFDGTKTAEVSSAATDYTGLILNNTSASGKRYNLASAGSGSYFDIPTGAFGIRDLTAGATRFILDTSGNLGVGVVPSAWNSNGRGIQLFNSASRASAFATWYGAIGVLNDAYYGTDNNFKYYSGGAVALYQQSAGVHTWQTAGSGTAGNTITWAGSMTLDASGRVGIGNASPNRKLYVQSDDSSTGGNVVGVRNSNTTAGAFVNFLAGGSNAPSIGAKNNDIVFTADGYSGTEWVRITSAGSLGIGTSSPNAKLQVTASSAGAVYTALTLQNTDNSSSGQGSQIVFKNSSYDGVEAQKYGYIRYKAVNNYGERGQFVFGTNNGYNVAPVDRFGIDAQGDIYTNINGGSLYPRAGSAYAAITDLGWTAPIQVQETQTGTGSYRYVPMISQTSLSPSGYRQHTVLGSARGTVWGDFFIALGGNDNYPTLAFYFSYGGVFTAPSTKNFVIPHPLKGLNKTHELVHAAIEAPRADLIYRGVVQLVDGQAQVNVDADSRMTDGTLEALCRNFQCFTTNESDWTPVRGSLSGNVLTIQAQDANSTAQVSWMVIGERKDENVMRTYDEQGRFIVERPAKTFDKE